MNSSALAIGRMIGQRRDLARETKSGAARATGIPRIKIWRIEVGRQMPDANDLWRLADHFNCSIDELIGRSRLAKGCSDAESIRSSRVPDTLQTAMLIVVDARSHGAEPRVNLLGILKMGLEAISDRKIASKLERAIYEREGEIIGYLRWEEAQPPVGGANA